MSINLEDNAISVTSAEWLAPCDQELQATATLQDAGADNWLICGLPVEGDQTACQRIPYTNAWKMPQRELSQCSQEASPHELRAQSSTHSASVPCCSQCVASHAPTPTNHSLTAAHKL